MIATISPGPLRGIVRAPSSKSAAHRALICAALSDGPTQLHLTGLNEDISATIACLTALGARIDWEGERGQLSVRPAGRSHMPAAAPLDLHCGESGSTLRFLLPLACALGAKARLTGCGRLPERPNAALVQALRAHGAAIDSDLLPMNVSGPLSGGRWELPGNVSSQYITGLMFALPLLREDSEIRLTAPLASAAYVDMTLGMLDRFGIAVEPTASGWLLPGRQSYRSPGALTVEGDWSAAAFWFAANALGSHISVEGLSPDSAQGDRAATELLGQRTIDATNVPDLVPALAAAAAVLPQRTVITGAARLRLKESDRLEAVSKMIASMGGRAEVTADGLILQGCPQPHGGVVNGYSDHRIVMAAAILATHADGPVTITGAEAVNKSYPDFFRDFAKLGGRVHVE